MFPEYDIFIDQAKPKAMKWREENDKKLVNCDLVLLILTPAALISNEVQREFELTNNMNKQILPCKMNVLDLDWQELPWGLGSLDGISFENYEDLQTSLFGAINKIRKESSNKLQNSSNTIQNFITVELNNHAYYLGDRIIISGKVEELLSNTSVQIKIISPSNQIVSIFQTEVNSDKQYETIFTADDSLMNDKGDYLVHVQYGNQSRSADTIFYFEGSSNSSISTTNEIVPVSENLQLSYDVQGGKVLSMVKDADTFSIVVSLESHADGIITLTVPRYLLDARIDDHDDKFLVFVDGDETDFDESNSLIVRTLKIPFLSNSKEIEIIGTIQSNTIPLFEKLNVPAEQSNNVHIISLSVSFDRTVYPLNSKFYIRVNCQDIIFGKMINLDILTINNDLIISKQIDPITHSDSELKQIGIYEESFTINSKDWKIGETYIVRASHGDAFAEDSCVIDQRTPIIQSDKLVYLCGSDVIITVIDPDADKDLQKPEFVGNSADSILTISSRFGSIKGYQLKETGNSTGIFQGVIRLIGTFDDGTAVPCYYENKCISKTQGTGISDGFLQVSTGDEITITYKRGSETATLTAFSSNFGYTIELDQKVYTWTDRVYVTIVAPDFNMDPDKIEKIGGGDIGTIIIKTRMGIISNYELIETGPDTGIFTGEFCLTGFRYGKIPPDLLHNFENTLGNGPTDGQIAVGSNDGLTIEFKRGSTSVVASALIRWNVGEIQWHSANYPLDGIGSLVVIDPDMSLNHDFADTFKIRVWSDSDPVGTEIYVTETEFKTGIFSGSIQFGTETKDGKTLKVSLGDTITAKYVDFTLPYPYSENDSIDMTAIAQII